MITILICQLHFLNFDFETFKNVIKMKKLGYVDFDRCLKEFFKTMLDGTTTNLKIQIF